MTSEKDAPYSEAYVWIWLPDATEPVVAGLLSQQGGALVFNYGRSYLARPDAIAIYAPELPLRPGALALLPGLNMPSFCHQPGNSQSRNAHVTPSTGFSVMHTNSWSMGKCRATIERSLRT